MANRKSYTYNSSTLKSWVKWKSLLFWLGLTFVFLLSLLIVSSVYFWKRPSGEIVSSQVEDFPQVPVAIVPGAAVYGKIPSPVLMDRLACGLSLYQAKKVKKILLSGDNGQNDYNELRPMLSYMLKAGVKPEDIFVDHAGFRTLDTLIRAKQVFHVQEAIFVSQSFFLPRALYLGSSLDLKLHGFPCNLRKYKRELYYQLREVPARTLAWWDILWETPPKYLGKPYPISGSGLETWKGSIPVD